MPGERRKYLRVMFEETIQVEATEWTDSMATGLDISLNGTRFHCEHSLSEAEVVTVVFRPDLKLQGEVRWCWPIEWYYQAAVEFINMTSAQMRHLRDYITETTGEPYPEYSEEDLAPAPEEASEAFDLGAIEEMDGTEGMENLGEEDSAESSRMSSSSSEEGITPHSFEGKHIVIVDNNEAQIEAITQYLTKRTQFNVGFANKKSSLWPLLKAQPADLILLSWQLPNEDPLAFLREIQQRFAGTPVIFIAGPVSLEARLQGLNAGAVDFITRPVHLSAIAQSILKSFAFLLDRPGSVPFSSMEDEHEVMLDEDNELQLSDDFLTDEFSLEDEKY